MLSGSCFSFFLLPPDRLGEAEHHHYRRQQLQRYDKSAHPEKSPHQEPALSSDAPEPAKAEVAVPTISMTFSNHFMTFSFPV